MAQWRRTPVTAWATHRVASALQLLLMSLLSTPRVMSPLVESYMRRQSKYEGYTHPLRLKTLLASGYLDGWNNLSYYRHQQQEPLDHWEQRDCAHIVIEILADYILPSVQPRLEH